MEPVEPATVITFSTFLEAGLRALTAARRGAGRGGLRAEVEAPRRATKRQGLPRPLGLGACRACGGLAARTGVQLRYIGRPTPDPLAKSSRGGP